MKKCAHCKTIPTTRKYCSNACSQAAYRKRKKHKENEERVRLGLQPFPFKRPCRCGCGVMMPIENKQSDKRLLYWTDACRMRAHRAKGKTQGSKICSMCDSKFSPANARQRFCSDKCKAKAYRARKRDKERTKKTRLNEIIWKAEGEKRIWLFDYVDAKKDKNKQRCADLIRKALADFGDYWTITHQNKIDQILS